MTAAPPRLATRLRRILAMLPYAIRHPGIGVDELARKFGVARNDLLDDLNLLFMCGLPGYGPGDLIDVSVDEDHVYVRMADYFEAPLRLTAVEALSLYAGGAALASMPDMGEADALKRGLAKLGRALGAAAGTTIDVQVEAGPADHIAAIKDALEEHKRVRMEYFSASSGELSQREVDPWLLYAALGRWYLIGWDHGREDERMFRVDRIKSVAVLDKAADEPKDLDVSRYVGAFRSEPEQSVARLEISPRAARWFEEYYPVRSATTGADGWRTVELEYSSAAWLARLVLSLGDDVRSIQPTNIASAARDLAREILTRYA
ncbi:MAG: WYL domain-containing protein [Actinomycetota bacterium]|nr:WYL domain-containing protein [Actinomycetota bacterium]